MIEAANLMQVEALSKVYHMGSVPVAALGGVTFNVPDGDMLCIAGKSGSGKSTLLRQLGLLDRPSEGHIVFQGRMVTGLTDLARSKLRLNAIGYVFQEFALLPELNAHENIYLPGMMRGGHSWNYRRRAAELLDVVGLEGRHQHRPKELSGGEQQRVAIARALINQPVVLFADEPCANLDSGASARVMRTLSEINRERGVTIVFVSHEVEDRQYARHWLTLADGLIVEDATAGGEPA